MQLWHRLRPVHHHMFYLRLCLCAMEPSYLLCIRKVMYLQHRKANTPTQIYISCCTVLHAVRNMRSMAFWLRKWVGLEDASWSVFPVIMEVLARSHRVSLKKVTPSISFVSGSHGFPAHLRLISTRVSMLNLAAGPSKCSASRSSSDAMAQVVINAWSVYMPFIYVLKAAVVKCQRREA